MATTRTALVIAEEWEGVCSESMTREVKLELLLQFMDKHNRKIAVQEAFVKLVCEAVDNLGLTDKLDDFLRAAAEGGLADPEAE